MVATNYVVYQLIDNSIVVYIGMTKNLNRRIDEHIREGLLFTRYSKLRKDLTKSQAKAEEKKQLREYKKKYGSLPKYNDRV